MIANITDKNRLNACISTTMVSMDSTESSGAIGHLSLST